MATNVNNETGLIGITPKYKFHDQVTIDTGDTIQDVTWLDCEYLAKFKKNSLGPMIVRPDYIYEDTAGSLARNGVTIVGVTTENTLARVTDPEVLRILLANISHTLDNQIRLSEVASGSIGAAWFAGNTKIEIFDCPRGYSVAASAFNGCTGLREVFIQRNVSLGNSAFNGCNRVNCYHFLDTNVGTFGTTVFSGLSGSCYLYVPNEAVVNYCKVANLGSYITRIRGHIKGWHLICADGSYKYNLRDCYDTATNISFRLEGTYVTNLALSVDPDTNEATVTVTGMLPDTDENAQLYYEFDYRNHHFSGYVPLHLKTGAAEIIEFEDPEVKRICVANWGGIYRMTLDGYEGELTKEQAAKVSSIGTAFRYANVTYLDLSMFTSVTSFSTSHLSDLTARCIILPPNARSIENYGIARSKVTYLIITYTAGTFAFNGSWNNSSSISYICVPDTKVSAYSSTVYPIIGQESIIEKDREFTLTAPEAKFGWNSDLHWTVEENDYISIVSQEDGVATFRATGILPDTDTTVTLSYQSNHGNGLFAGTKVLIVKPTPIIEFQDSEVKRICVNNWGGALSIRTKVPGIPGELTYDQAASVTSLNHEFQSTAIQYFHEFQYFTHLTSITKDAFKGASNLKEITLPLSLKTLTAEGSGGVFRNCSKLTTVNNTSQLTTINGSFNFYEDRALLAVDLENCTYLGGGTFYNCTSLRTVGSLDKIVTIGNATSWGAFTNTKLSGELYLPNCTNTFIPNYFINNCSGITKVVMPKANYTSIGDYAFNGSGIKRFTIREGCTTINNHAFSYSTFQFLDFPSTLKTCNNYFLYDSTGLRTLIVRATNPPSIGNTNSFRNFPAACKVYVPFGSLNTYKTRTTWSKLASRYLPLEESVWGYYHDEDAPEYISFEDAAVEEICANNWGDSVLKEVTEVVTDESEIVDITTVFTFRSMLNTTVQRTETSMVQTTRAKVEGDVAGTATTSTRIPLGITKEQAAAVSSIGTKFKGNTIITAFMELQYFTGSVSYDNSHYYYNDQNGSTSMFQGCTQLQKVKIPEGVTIMQNLFRNCNALVFVDLPSTAQRTSAYIWSNTPAKRVICRATTPPTFTQGDAYGKLNPTRGIYVPDESVNTYKSTSRWSEFASYIHPLSEWDGTY